MALRSARVRILLRHAPTLLSEQQPIQQPEYQSKLEHLVQRVIEMLQRTRTELEPMHPAIQTVDQADLITSEILGGGGAAEHTADRAVDSAQPTRPQWPFDIAKENDAIVRATIFGPMHKGFVKQHVLAIAPRIHLAINENPALVTVWRDQPEVIAQRTGKRIAVRVQLRTGRKQGEHRGLDARHLPHQGDALRAQCLCRGQRFVVPLQVKTLPAFLEKRIEAGIVVLQRRLDMALVRQAQRFIADHLPVIAKDIELWKCAAIQIRSRRYRREQIQQRVDRRQHGRMIEQLSMKRQPHAAAQVYIEHTGDKQRNDDELGR